MQNCLEENYLSQECLTLLDNENIKEICEQTDLRDNCYHEAAIVNNNESYCFEIRDESIKEDCKNVIILLNPENESLLIPEEGMPS